MGGAGSGIAYNETDLRRIAGAGLQASPTTEVLLEESIIGWKEYELELMRDRNDNVVVVCSIENLDPMGVHTGDSITVAPALTLTDREYQHLRDIAIEVLRAVGVDTGGCNIQFAVQPETGRVIVVEMNPRVSRSSALASKATGFPIAKIAAKLALGYTLDEIPNDITRKTPASFEPSIDYVVVKVPRFAFEKFPGVDDTLTTTMKSVGEAMSIGRNFTEALQKALRSLEQTGSSFRWDGEIGERDELIEKSSDPPTAASSRSSRRSAQAQPSTNCTTQPASTRGSSIRSCCSTRSRPTSQRRVTRHRDPSARQAARILRCANRRDPRCSRGHVRDTRHEIDLRPVYKTVDTCAAEFAAKTPYHYSSYDDETEVVPRTKPAVLILGSGPEPNRPGRRVRLLLRARKFRLARGRVRNGDDQLQPRDGVDRLRHQRPPLLRTAHA